jgi:hypothetical protein
MELKNLFNIIFMFVLIGVLIGIGIIVFDNFGDAAKTETTIVNETVAVVGRAGTTTNDEVQSVTWFGNTTYPCSSFNSATACLNWTEAGAITTNSTYLNNANYKIIYSYDADTAATTAVGNTSSALDDISATWLSLLITVTVLAIVLGIVVKSFSNTR